jgi:hypothetical protein
MGFLGRILGPGDRDEFAAACMRALRERDPACEPAYDAAAFALRLADGSRLNLHNAWDEVERGTRGERAAMARRHALAFAVSRERVLPETWEEAAPKVFPKLRARVWYDLIRHRARAEGREPLEVPYRVIGEHYAVEVVCDFPETCSSVTAPDLARWGRPFEDVLTTATRNLRARPAESIAALATDDGGTVHVVMSGDTYDATRLFAVDQVLEQIGRRHDPVAIPLHRGALLLADPDDPASVTALVALAEEQFGAPYANAAVPVRRASGAWAPWLPPEGHPSRRAVEALVQRSVLRDHAEQQEALQAAEGGDSAAVFVASVLGPEEGGEARTFAVWTQGLRTWLPRADVAVLLWPRPDGSPGSSLHVPWDRLVEIAAEAMKPLDCFPPRWEVCDFPDEPTLARLVAAGTRRSG